MRSPSVAVVAAASALLLALPALAAPPSPDQAEALVARKAWDELFLAFGATKARDVAKPARPRTAGALEAGARGAQADKDPALALSLAEKAAELQATVARHLLVARIAGELQQASAAVAAADAALKLAPKDPAALEARALLHEGDGEFEKAGKLWKRVGPKAPNVGAAREGLSRCLTRVEELNKGKAALAATGSGTVPGLAGAAGAPGSGGNVGPQSAAGRPGAGPARGDLAAGDPFGAHDDPSSVGGMRSRTGKEFRIVYSDKGDFGRRAAYEHRVEQALGKARDYVCPRLGHCPTQSIEVVLYTREEFDLHFGGSALGQAAGFFAGKIRINDAQEISDEVQTVLVHEYVHAAIADALYPEQIPAWLNEGIAKYVELQWLGTNGELPQQERLMMKEAAAAGRAPHLPELEGSFINLGGSLRIHMAYLIGATAARLLDERKRGRFPELFSRVKGGEPLEAVIADLYGWSPGKLDQEVQEELAR